MTTAHLAREGFEEELDDELGRAGVVVSQVHGLLRVCEGPPVHAAWAANTWWDAQRLGIASIGDAARQLRERQRNWALYAPVHRGRAELVAQRLPHVAARPLELGEVAPDAPLGSWTLLDRDTMLCATACTSPFPNGVPAFVEDRDGPPSRAYLKLWEVFALLRRQPGPGDRCLDLGAAPGGWTWLLARTGADVLAVDRAPLHPRVAALPRVRSERGSAFTLDPTSRGEWDWVCSDVIAYPDRLVDLVESWVEARTARTLVVTIKLQGATDHRALARARAVPGARLLHLSQNRHELTCVVGG